MKNLWLWVLIVIAIVWYWHGKKEDREGEAVRADKARVEAMRAEQAEARGEAVWREGDKRMWEARRRAMEERLQRPVDGGYRWGSASWLYGREVVERLGRAIENDDWKRVEQLGADAERAVASFEAGCEWMPGSPHKNYAHIHAAEKEGCWVADDGWMFTMQGSLETVKIPKPPSPAVPVVPAVPATPVSPAVRAAPAAPAAPMPPPGPSLEERRAMAAWGAGDKRRYVSRSRELSERIEARQAGGYDYGSSSLSKARSALQTLDRAIDRDEWATVPGLFGEAEEAVRLFEASCRWKPGLRHSRFPHIKSAEREGVWNADSGWTFLSRDSLEVVQICSRCNGSGQETVRVDCPQCNGRGRVKTTLGSVTEMVDGLSMGIQAFDNFGRALHGKPAHTGATRHDVQMVDCNNCNRTGKVTALKTCSRCGGTGYIR